MDGSADPAWTARAYDANLDAYVQFAGTELSAATETPSDLDALRAFVEHVRGRPAGRVADLGCGPGRVAAFLASHGLEVLGLDVSPAMVKAARLAHPHLVFEEGRLTAVPVLDRSLAGAVCWYSIIHTPPDQLDDVGAELARVLGPGGHLLVAFQAGEGEAEERTYASGARLIFYRHDPGAVARVLTGVGMLVDDVVIREPHFEHESTPQALISAHAVG